VSEPAQTPELGELIAPAAWANIDFISDLHLAQDTPQTFGAWAAYLNDTDADAVFILGDLFEVWPGDDARESDFEARCVDTLSRAATKRSIYFMAGNRDFLLGADMLRACAMRPLADPTVLVAFGQRIVLTHGDALSLADTEYQQFRVLVRAASWQRAFLSLPLAQRREMARQVRAGSEQRKFGQAYNAGFDIDPALAVQWLRSAGSTTLIHGHTHRPESAAIAPGFVRHVLSDWDLDHAAPARAEVMRLSGLGLMRRRPPP
jgi:UDP-2,3-diacylglucosamine hydrolase